MNKMHKKITDVCREANRLERQLKHIENVVEQSNCPDIIQILLLDAISRAGRMHSIAIDAWLMEQDGKKETEDV